MATASQVKDVFTIFDKTGEGYIETKMLGTAIRACGFQITEKERVAYEAEADPSGEGVIDFATFQSLLAKPRSTAGTFEDLRQTLRVFDRDDLGVVYAAEIRQVMTNLGERIGDEEANEFLDLVDADERGQFDYTSLAKKVMATSS
eukprot:CAMPEP_0174244026 /NCGR_PEP_ID=MMETSP0417-20130205/33715_1 /TAXON_ID=242541 /ORGANISM="Mayorella sp, Strain BSH-02190019" /LENGTH=145 /DNA_ID=CAMNT_0015323643 /DNA_START=98 /DNA_END=531 /DNA_ORIENTATION=-